jgi:hypothetical protein
MSSKESRSKRSLESIELAGIIPESSEKLQCLTLLYALFEKFGDSFSKEKFNDNLEGKLPLFQGGAKLHCYEETSAKI